MAHFERLFECLDASPEIVGGARELIGPRAVWSLPTSPSPISPGKAGLETSVSALHPDKWSLS